MTIRTRRGFTLVEVMIASVLLAIGLLAMLALQLHALRGSQLGRHYTGAGQIAREKMEELMRVPFADPDLTAGAGWKNDGNQTLQVSLEGGGASSEQVFKVEHRVSSNPATTTTLRQIDVRVTWYEPKDDPAPAPPRRRYAVTSLRYQP